VSRGKKKKAARRKTEAAEAKAEAAKAEAQVARDVMDRALKRLNVLEYLILVLGAVLALAGGGLVAWILSSTADLPFRASWAVASLLLFIVPGGLVYLRELRSGPGP